MPLKNLNLVTLVWSWAQHQWLIAFIQNTYALILLFQTGLTATTLFFSTDLFDVQSDDYKEAILPKAVRRRVAIEMAATQPWYKYVGLDGKVIGIDKFGASALAAEVIEKIWLHR